MPADFAWRFWTNVSNWTLDSDVESVEIDGPFAAGARGATIGRISGRIEWRVVEAGSGRAVIEFPVPKAVARFAWQFVETVRGTTITQRCWLEGESASKLARNFGPVLEAGIPDGMRKLCLAMEAASARWPAGGVMAQKGPAATG